MLMRVAMSPGEPVYSHMFPCVRTQCWKAQSLTWWKSLQFTISQKCCGHRARQHSDTGSLSRHPTYTSWNSLLHANLVTLWKGSFSFSGKSASHHKDGTIHVFTSPEKQTYLIQISSEGGKDRPQRACFRQEMWALHMDQGRLLGADCPSTKPSLAAARPASQLMHSKMSREKELLWMNNWSHWICW